MAEFTNTRIQCVINKHNGNIYLAKIELQQRLNELKDRLRDPWTLVLNTTVAHTEAEILQLESFLLNN